MKNKHRQRNTRRNYLQEDGERLEYEKGGKVKMNPGVEDYLDARAEKEQFDSERRQLGKILSSWTEVKTLPQQRGLYFTVREGMIRTHGGVFLNNELTFVPYLDDFTVDVLNVSNNTNRNRRPGLEVTFDKGYEPTRKEMPAPNERIVDGETVHYVYNTPRMWNKAKHALRAHDPSLQVGGVAIRNIRMPHVLRA